MTRKVRKMTMKEKEAKERRERRQFTAQEKTQAVLSIWAERRKPSEICKELAIEWALLRNWEHRALEAMMAALEPRSAKAEERIPALGAKLQQLLERSTARRMGQLSKFQRRLTKIQEVKTQEVKS